MNPQLTVVIPCLNEAQTLASVIEEVRAGLCSAKLQGEIIISDNGSTDESREIAVGCGAQVVNAPIRGYGAALHFGIVAAKSEWVLFGDADMSYDFHAIERFADFIRGNMEGDLILGSRLRGEIEPGAMPYLNRYLGTPVLNLSLRLLFGLATSDCNSGMRLIRRSAYLRMAMRSHGMEWASELLIKAQFLGMKYREVPIPLRRDQRGRPSHLRRWRDGWRHLKTVVLLAPMRMILLPAFAMLVAGILALWLESFALSVVFISTAVTGVILSLTVELWLHNDGVRISPWINKLLEIAFAEMLLIGGAFLFISGTLPLFFMPWQLDRIGTLQLLSSLAGSLLMLGSFFWGTVLTHTRSKLVTPYDAA